MENGTKVVVQRATFKEVVQVTLNLLILVFTAYGLNLMMENTDSGAGLMSKGLENLKYFTVLSNVFAGIVAVLWIVFFIMSKPFPALPKLMSASAVGLTFVVITFFLRPLYPDLNLYKGGNLYFHLIIPLMAMVDFILLNVYNTKIETDDVRNRFKIPFKTTLFSAGLAVIYGIGYVINILINGIGEWPETNDWYGFLNWGYPIGICIFLFIVLMDFGIACLLRFLNYHMNCFSFKLFVYMHSEK